MATLLDDAFELLEVATKLEENEMTKIEAATKFYEAVYLLKRYVQRLPRIQASQEIRALIEDKIKHYEAIASSILGNQDSLGREKVSGPRSPLEKHSHFSEDSSVVPLPPPSPASPRFGTGRAWTDASAVTKLAGQANTRLSHALDLDEKGKEKAAVAEYMAAAELYLNALKAAESVGSSDDSISLVLRRRLEGALDRAEQLKLPAEKRKSVVHEAKVREQKHSAARLTKDEVDVLKRSSLIASGVFLPWSDDDAKALAAEVRRPSAPLWIDPDGFLPLSDKQKAHFHKWARPTDIAKIRYKMGLTPFFQEPVMVKSITPYTIKQSHVTDCSFISSLIICAAFERRFGKRLVTSLIHPQTAAGVPICSPTGKYMVRFWLNGCERVVFIDDYLPIDRFGNLCVSHTSSKAFELWVPLIEKAYMKLCGGYDFPGSNSGVDLFSLTGWIPERIFFAKDPANIKDFETPPDRAWERLCSATSFGDCLITVSSTPDLREAEATQIGLVTGHAYAVLSAIQTKDGTRLLQLKNPWAYKSWKGRYSCHDHASWRKPNLRAEVGYDPVLASKYDDGVFWISWDDVLIYFQNLHLSWNKSLFSFQVTTHGFWPLHQGPKDDTFNVGENPQYILQLSDAAVSKKASIWILLSRHVTKQEQEGSEVTDFLTIHLHRNNSSKERIWYPSGKTCIVTGAYTNNPHVLMRYDVTSMDDKYLSIVLSQYKKSRDISFTLSCFSTEGFSLSHPSKDLPFRQVINSEWTQSSAGGPPGHSSFRHNPMWAVQVPEKGADIQLRCSAAKSFAVNVMLVANGARVTRLVEEAILIDSGDYRHGFVSTVKNSISGGLYTLVVSTFHPGQIGSFQLKVYSSSKLTLTQIA